VDDILATKSEDVGLIFRAISFQDFPPMWSWSTNVTDGQTDGQTTSDSKTALCTVVHRAVKTVHILHVIRVYASVKWTSHITSYLQRLAKASSSNADSFCIRSVIISAAVSWRASVFMASSSALCQIFSVTMSDLQATQLTQKENVKAIYQ